MIDTLLGTVTRSSDVWILFTIELEDRSRRRILRLHLTELDAPGVAFIAHTLLYLSSLDLA
jgi:hypothetical protein